MCYAVTVLTNDKHKVLLVAASFVLIVSPHQWNVNIKMADVNQ